MKSGEHLTYSTDHAIISHSADKTMPPQERPIIYGQTGDPERDGLLTPDQLAILDELQREAAETGFSHLQSMEPGEHYPMAAMATGIGKGNIIHRVIERQVRLKPDSRILVIVGTKVVLVDQTQEALSEYQGGVTPNGHIFIEAEDSDELNEDTTTVNENHVGQKSLLYRTTTLRKKDGNVHVATIQSVQSEIQRGRLQPEDYDLVIVDEVHNIGTEKRVATIKQFRRVIGFTATPYRHTGVLKQPEHYGFAIATSLPLPEAQELGLLPPLVGMQIETKNLVDTIPLTPLGLIDYKKLEKILKNSDQLRPHIVEKIASIIREEGKTYKTVIAVNYVWEAEEIAKLLREKGIKVGIAVNKQAAKKIHSDRIPARDAIERYKLPESDPESVQVLISPYVASEGFDAPFTEVLVWASPTDSSLRYTQYTGRLARRARGKAFGLVIDCLYQTDQYTWSYNFGMWMKGNVVELESGLLYLGPSSEITGVSQLPSLVDFQRISDRTGLREMQKELIQKVQETDFVVSKDSLTGAFIGGKDRVIGTGRQVYEEIAEQYPWLVAERLNGSRRVKVITDRPLFIQTMEERGVKARPQEVVQVETNDFPVSVSTLTSIFSGHSTRLMTLAQQVLAGFDSNLVYHANRGSTQVPHVRNKELFIAQMVEAGASLREVELELVKATDFPITHESLRNVFIGTSARLMEVAQEIVVWLQADYPELVAYRDTGYGSGLVVTDREAFIQAMQARGRKLKPVEIEVTETDVMITNPVLYEFFVGDREQLPQLAKTVLEEMARENPASVFFKEHNWYVRDSSRFVEGMVAQGARVRAQLEPMQETDFPITYRSIRATFQGDTKRVMAIAQEVVQQLEAEDASLIAQRDNNPSTTTVATNPDVFIGAMLARGIKLKE